MLMKNTPKHSLSASIGFTLLLAVAAASSQQASANTAPNPGGKAGKSTQLVVDKAFTFATHRTLQLDVSVTDDEGIAQGRSMVRIFTLKPDMPEQVAGDEEEVREQYSLLSIASTDEAGWLTMPLDVPAYVTRLKIVVDQVGVENTRVIELDDSNNVSVLF